MLTCPVYLRLLDDYFFYKYEFIDNITSLLFFINLWNFGEPSVQITKIFHSHSRPIITRIYLSVCSRWGERIFLQNVLKWLVVYDIYLCNPQPKKLPAIVVKGNLSYTED